MRTQLQTQFARQVRTIALDRLEASLALAGIKPPTVAVQNDAPQVFVSYSPAILVPIDGAPVLKPVPDHSRFQRDHQHQGADPAGRLGPEVLPARLRRLARSRCPRRAVDAVAGAADRHGPRRGGDRQDRRRRHARRRHQRPAEALARQRRADDLHQPGAGRADRLQGPAGLRADRRHATAVGRQHEQRRADRHRQQQLLRADGGPLVPRCRPVRPVELRAERRAAGRLRAHPAAGAGRGRAADGGRHAAGAGGGDLELDPADGDGAAEERPDLHAELRRPAAARADRRHLDVVRGQRVGTADPGGARRPLCGRRRRLVHGARS